MTVEHVLPHDSNQTTSHMNRGSGIDMVVGQVTPQLNEHRADYIDVDKMDGTSGTPPLTGDRNRPSHTTSPLVRERSLPQGLVGNDIPTTIPVNSPSLKAAADLVKDTETEPNVPDATKPKSCRSPENSIALHDVTTSSSFNSTGFHSGMNSATSDNDTGHIPLVTAHSMINNSHSPKPPESALLSPKTSNLQSFPNTLSSAPVVDLPSEDNFRPPASQNSTLPSSTATTAAGNDDLLPASSEGETILAVKDLSIPWLLIIDVIKKGITTSTINGIISAHSSSQHPCPSGPIPDTSEGRDPCPVPQPTCEQLKALRTSGCITALLMFGKGLLTLPHQHRRFWS